MAVHMIAGVAFVVYNGYVYYTQFNSTGTGMPVTAAVMIVVAVIALFGSGALLSEGENIISMSWLHRLFTLILLAGMVFLIF
jgi:hypothetical protein